MKVQLEVTAGPDQGLSFAFSERDRFLVGRSPTAHFSLAQDPYFSRHHLMMEVNPPNVLLQDLRSTNGTYVNGTRVESVFLQHGDVISGGDTCLTFSIIEEDVVLESLYDASTSSAKAPPSAEKVAVRCLRCGAKAMNELPRRRSENMAYFCHGCQSELVRHPKLLPGYRVVKEIGRGGMGAVYLAEHDVLGRRAIKMILPRAAMAKRVREMFVREAASQASLDHPHIVRVHDFQETAPGIFCLVMEFVDGCNARSLLEEYGQGLPLSMAVTIVNQGLEALQHAHERGLVHRDIKDANLLVDMRAAGPNVKLTDFGLAKSYELSGASGFTSTSEVSGTLPYMAPEQILNFRDVRPPADIYSMGVTFYRLLCGRLPHDFQNGVDPLITILEASIVPLRERNAAIPAKLAVIVERALSKDSRQRFGSAGEMRAAILGAT